MPDLLVVFSRRWKLILGLTALAMAIAFIFSLLSPKKFLATATALPANSLAADKARIYNDNIEVLYSEIGSPDELDRLIGTATLDTIFIAAANELNLAAHYSFESSGEGPYKAAIELKKNSRINRSGYGELKVKVWDRDRNMAAAVANSIMNHIQQLHQRLQNENNQHILQRLTEDYQRKQEQFKTIADSFSRAVGVQAELLQARKAALITQIQEYENRIDQYQMAVSANPRVLLTVEAARAPLWHDKPKTLPTVLLCGFAAFLFGWLIAVFTESRKATR